MDDLHRQLYAVNAVREFDRRAIALHGIPGYTLMQRAAAAAWQDLRERWPQAQRIAVVCGRGNNGGDGYVLARLAQEAGCEVQVFSVDGPPQPQEAAQAYADWCGSGGAVHPSSGAGPLLRADVIVDALFGVGLSRPPNGAAAEAIRAMNLARTRGAGILALDVPSGLNADTGQAYEPTIEADFCSCFIAYKAGLFTGDGPQHAPHLRLHTLHVPKEAYEDVSPTAQLLQPPALSQWLRPRRRTAHKGLHGHVLIVGGDQGMAGAALMAGRAALRAGAGLVTLATRATHVDALIASQPELMGRGVESTASLAPLMERADVIAVGPGLGLDPWGEALLNAVAASEKPQVWDADALNLLAQRPRRASWVLTPHPGEAARLLGCSTRDVQSDRFAALRELEARFGGVVVLKGAGTLISGTPPRLCPYGNPGMAVGGMGDVLTGIIAGLIAQGLPSGDAAAAGVLIHALAGDRAARDGERGLLPSDLLAELRHLVNPAPHVDHCSHAAPPR